MWAKLGLAVLVLASGGACSPNEAPPLVNPSPRPEHSSREQVSVPRCSDDIPFELTYLPEDFSHKQFEGPFPGGRPLDDPRSTGGNRHQQQVVVHYRASGGRAIEIRRSGTIFTELAQRDDAPTIEVLGTETTGFAPIGPGGNEFIVSFRYPPGAGPHQWCSLYSLNEYGVPLAELKKVAIGLRAHLPKAVAEVRTTILEAAEDGAYKVLRSVLEPETFLSDFGYGIDPIDRWAKIGDEPLALMAALLQMDHVTEDSNEGRLIRWPVYDAETKSLDDITDRDRDLFLSVMSPQEFRRLIPNDEYGYVGPRLGILADGTWWFFIMEPGP